MRCLEAGCEGEQGDVARLLDCEREATLVTGADTGQAARNDLATLGHEALQQTNVAVADGIDLLGAELADLLAAEELASAGTTGRSAGGTGRTRTARTGERGTGVGGVGRGGERCRSICTLTTALTASVPAPRRHVQRPPRRSGAATGTTHLRGNHHG